jgi:predicted nucleotidyltransferase
MLDLSQRHELDWLAQLVADVQSAAPSIEPLVVGALARDLLLHYGHGVKISRVTADADFALAVADWNEFSKVRNALMASTVFAPHRHVAHRLQHAKFGPIDLIPFGSVEQPDGTIAWPPSGDEVMGVLGYAEAAASSISVTLPSGQSVRVVSLPMLAVLKVFAWSDRHRSTQGKDAVDLGLILRSYLDTGNVDRLYTEFRHLITDRFDFEPTSGWMLGSDARAALLMHSARFDQVIERLDSILVRELATDRQSPLVAQLNPVRADQGLKLIEAFHSGLMGAGMS